MTDTLVTFRPATHADIPAVVALLSDDMLGRDRQAQPLSHYLAAFDQMLREGANQLIVGEAADRIIATYQITFISGLSRTAARRAQIEAVRIASDQRGQGLGTALFADAEARAIAAGCALIQLTTDKRRADAHRFYDRLGFTGSHIGYKKAL